MSDTNRIPGDVVGSTGPNPNIEIREPGEKNRIYESMTRVKHYDCNVRVWCREKEFAVVPRYHIINTIKAIPRSFDIHFQAKAIANALDAIEDVSAYEILDDLGNGGITYIDWP